MVDARLHGWRYDAATLEEFGLRLRRQLDVAAPEVDLTGTVQRWL